MKEFDKTLFDKKLNLAKSELEKATLLIEQLDVLSKLDDNEGIDKLLDEALLRTEMPHALYYKFVARKATILNRSGLIEEGLNLCLSFLDRIEEKFEDRYTYVYLAPFLLLFHTQLGNPEKAVALGEEIMAFIKEANDDKLYAISNELYRLTGAIAGSMGEVSKAVTYLESAIEVVEQYQDSNENLNIIHLSLGDLYFGNKDFSKALQHFEIGKKLSEELKDKYMLTVFLRLLGETSLELDELEKAENYFKAAFESLQNLNDAQSNALLLLNMAKLHLKTKQWGKYKTFAQQIEDSPYFRDNRNFKGEFYAIQSKYFLKIEDPTTALSFADKYEEITLELNDLDRVSAVYELKIQIYKGLRDFKNAVVYSEKLLDASSKVINESNRKLLEGYEAKFQNEKNEKEIQSLKLVTVSLQLQSLRAQMNPHFVFNTIGSISQDMNEDNIDQSKSLLRSFARMMKNNLEFAELESIFLKQEIEFLNDYLSLEKNRLGERLSFHIEAQEELMQLKIPSMIIQPYLENSIKHGINPLESGGKIELIFTQENNELICSISDNGVGRKQAAQNKLKSQEHLGKSTTINAKRLSLLNHDSEQSLMVQYTDLFDENKLPSGTQVRLAIKL